MIVPFVRIYVGPNPDYNYINPLLAICCTIMSLCSSFRLPCNLVVSSCGFFKQTWLQPLITAFVSLIVSILLGMISYPLVICGPIVFYLVNFIYQQIVLHKLVPELVDNEVIRIGIVSIVGVLLSLLLSTFTVNINSLLNWIIVAIVVSLITIGYIMLSSYLFNRRNWEKSFQFVQGLLIKH